MAKAAASNVPAVQKQANTLPAEFMNEVAGDAGMGSEAAGQDDMSIPFLKIAQALSPEIDKRDPAFIPGLEVGDFFNTATQKIYKGEEGFTLIPVYFVREYLEWTPRSKGGGFGGKHDASIMDKTSAGEKGENWLPNGNEIVVTATWFCIALDADGEMEQVVVSLAKTQAKKSRQLMTKLKTLLIAGPGGKKFNPPLFYNKLHVTSIPESNDQGNWMGWKFELNGSVFELPEGADLYSGAKGFLEAVRGGAVKAASPAAADETGGDAGESDNGGGKGAGADKEIPF